MRLSFLAMTTTGQLCWISAALQCPRVDAPVDNFVLKRGLAEMVDGLSESTVA